MWGNKASVEADNLGTVADAQQGESRGTVTTVLNRIKMEVVGRREMGRGWPDEETEKIGRAHV